MFWNRTSLLDAAMRLPIVGFTAFWLIREFNGLQNLIGAHPYFEWDLRFQLGVIARITLLLLLLCFAILHLARRQPIRKLPGWRPRIDALLGLTTAYFALLLPRPAATPLLDLPAESEKRPQSPYWWPSGTLVRDPTRGTAVRESVPAFRPSRREAS